VSRYRWGTVGLVGILLASGCTQKADAPPAGAGTVSGPLTVLAAASLTESFGALGREFEKAHPGVRVTFSFGASSSLAAQITEGAPADVFASAAPAPMETVRRDGDTVGEPRTFARNVLELAVPPDNPGRVGSLADLGRPGIRLALCAPQVPCGAAAGTVLAAAHVTAHPVTLAKDVKSVLALVKLGEVDAGLVYRTDVRSATGSVTGIEIPDAGKAVNDYPIAVVNHAPNPVAARAFVDFVLSRSGRAVLGDAGFILP
jgi:molybdate transport system substrate-binding protein